MCSTINIIYFLFPMGSRKLTALSFQNDDDDQRQGSRPQIKSLHETIRAVKGDITRAQEPELPTLSAKKGNISEIRAKIAAVKAELKGLDRHSPVSTPQDIKAKTEHVDSVARLLGVRNPPKEQQSAFKPTARVSLGKRGVPKKTDEVETLLALNRFREKLEALQTSDPLELSRKKIDLEPAKELEICKLHGLVSCASCRDTFGIRSPTEGATDEGWLMHRLVFDREAGYREAQAELNQLKVIDTRHSPEEYNRE